MAKLTELEVYNLALEIGEEVYSEIRDWEWFDKSTLGIQLIKSIDSIAANISEGFGRYYYKENKLFCYYARGSLTESITWITKALNRKLISEVTSNNLINKLELLHKKLNNYIKAIGQNKSQIMTIDLMT